MANARHVRLESLTYPISGVLFDAVGTLIEPDPPVAVAYATAGRRFGSSLSEVEIEPRFRAAFARQEALDAADSAGRTSETRERQRWRAIVGEVFDDTDDHQGLFDVLWQHFAEARHWRLLADAALALGRLADRLGGGPHADGRLVLAVASNFDARLETVCGGLATLTGCRLFISSQIGYRKPNPAFFRAIEARLKLTPEELLLVGDDLANDYQGALAAGWQAVLLDRHDRCRSARRVKSLGELLL